MNTLASATPTLKATTVQPVAPHFDEATETHNVVNATFFLVWVTFFLALITTAAIVVPLIVGQVRRHHQFESALAELDSIVAIVEDQLTALADSPLNPVAGAAIEFVVGRAFAADMAQALGAQSIATIYTALAQACDVIIACRSEERIGPQLPDGRGNPEYGPALGRAQNLARKAQDALAALVHARKAIPKMSATTEVVWRPQAQHFVHMWEHQVVLPDARGYGH